MREGVTLSIHGYNIVICFHTLMIFLNNFLFKCIVSLLTYYFYCHAFYTWASASDDRGSPIPRIDVNKLIDWLIDCLIPNSYSEVLPAARNTQRKLPVVPMKWQSCRSCSSPLEPFFLCGSLVYILHSEVMGRAASDTKISWGYKAKPKHLKADRPGNRIMYEWWPKTSAGDYSETLFLRFSSVTKRMIPVLALARESRAWCTLVKQMSLSYFLLVAKPWLWN